MFVRGCSRNLISHMRGYELANILKIAQQYAEKIQEFGIGKKVMHPVTDLHICHE